MIRTHILKQLRMKTKHSTLITIYTYLLQIEDEIEEKNIKNPIIDNAIHLIREEILKEIE